MLVAAVPAWAAHAYAQFGDVKYPPGFTHFDYVNPDAPKGGEFRLVPGTTPTNFDKFNPFTLKGTAPPGIASLMFESLLAGNAEEPTTAYGLLAEDVEVAPDKLSATFRLNPAARFNDGSTVQAEDVKFSFDTLTGPLAAPQFRTIYAEVKGVAVLGPGLLRFDFASPNAELPLVVGGMPVFSRKWGGGKPFDQITTDLPIASGPYRPMSARLGRDIGYQRDPKYWAVNLPVRKGHYNFDRISFKLYLDDTAKFEGLKAGEFDFMREFTSRNWARQYKGKVFDRGELKKRAFESHNPGDFQGYVFNVRNPKFQDARVRQALGLAFDFEWLNRQLFFGIYKRVDGYFPNSDFHAHDLPGADELALLEPLRAKLSPAVFGPAPVSPSTAPPSSLRDNLRKARDLLAQAGWTYRDGALRNARGEPMNIELLNNQPSLSRVVAPLQAALLKLGVTLEIRNVDSSLYQQRMDNFEFEMSSIRIPGSTAPGGELFEYFGSKSADTNGSANIWGIKDAAVDALLGRVVKATTRAELATAMRALDRVLSNGYYSIPQYYSDAFLIGYRQHRFVLPPTIPPYYQADSWAMSTWWASPENR
ncbi:extracellular solute-binding protein [Xylophilus rhododendri]|uniref:extracellular solute-binding protein n=1 Tax=Xylophilus rhododendri TaxID=2697032 RepID=UPI001E561154|nr:extracellular solute-binding protein [Xylophilus rhododendri]